MAPKSLEGVVVQCARMVDFTFFFLFLCTGRAVTWVSVEKKRIVSKRALVYIIIIIYTRCSLLYARAIYDRAGRGVYIARSSFRAVSAGTAPGGVRDLFFQLLLLLFSLPQSHLEVCQWVGMWYVSTHTRARTNARTHQHAHDSKMYL